MVRKMTPESNGCEEKKIIDSKMREIYNIGKIKDYENNEVENAEIIKIKEG